LSRGGTPRSFRACVPTSDLPPPPSETEVPPRLPTGSLIGPALQRPRLLARALPRHVPSANRNPGGGLASAPVACGENRSMALTWSVLACLDESRRAPTRVPARNRRGGCFSTAAGGVLVAAARGVDDWARGRRVVLTHLHSINGANRSVVSGRRFDPEGGGSGRKRWVPEQSIVRAVLRIGDCCRSARCFEQVLALQK